MCFLDLFLLFEFLQLVKLHLLNTFLPSKSVTLSFYLSHGFDYFHFNLECFETKVTIILLELGDGELSVDFAVGGAGHLLDGDRHAHGLAQDVHAAVGHVLVEDHLVLDASLVVQQLLHHVEAQWV